MPPSAEAPAPETPHELRDWLRALKQSSGMSYAQIAAAIGEEERNVKRWMSAVAEPVIPRGDVVLRLLSALGVRMTTPPPDSLRAMNDQIAELRELLGRVDDAIAQATSLDTAGRLRSLEAMVGELPTAEDVGRGLATLQAAIERLASRDTTEALRARPGQRDAR